MFLLIAIDSYLQELKPFDQTNPHVLIHVCSKQVMIQLRFLQTDLFDTSFES